MDFSAEAVAAVKTTTAAVKTNPIMEEYFKVGSVGFHPRGKLDEPLVLVLQ